MNITIKKVRRVVTINLIIFTLVGCANRPAPWVQADRKQADAEKNVPAEIVLSDALLNDPVLLAEPEPIMMEQPVAIVPVVIVPVVLEQQTPEQEIMALPTTSFAVQVYAGNTFDSVEEFKKSKNLTELKTVKTDRSGSIVYVLVDVQPDRSSANAAATELENKTGSKPWIRSVAGLQMIIAQ